MEEKDLIRKINEESENKVPDVYDKVIFAANAQGLFNNNNNDEQVYSDGETVALGGVNRKAIAITTLASVAAVCLAIALPIALSGKYDGGLSIPPIGDGGDKVVVDIDLRKDYAIGAVTTARLAESFLGTAETAATTAKTMTARTVSTDDFSEFGTYFSALDCFLGEGFDISDQTSTEKYANSVVFSGQRVSGDKFKYGMYYTEYKIQSNDYVDGDPVNYYLEGVIQFSDFIDDIHNVNFGKFSLVGERTLSSEAVDAEETALTLYAYPNLADKTTYALMELDYEEIDGVAIRSYSYKIVKGGETLGEAVAYKPSDEELVIDVKDNEESNGVFNITGRTEDNLFDVNYTMGENRGKFTVQTTTDGLEYFLEENGFFTYVKNDDGTCSINGYNANLSMPENLIIPSSIDGMPVVSIRNSAFNNKLKAKKLVISEGIQEIGNLAFYWGKALESVQLPTSLTKIGYQAFSNCSNLLEINLPDNLISIGFKAFECCNKITKVIIPSNAQYIDADVFFECTSLKTVEIPASVTYLGTGVFAGCARLESITVDANNSVYHSKDNCLIETESKTLVAGCKTSKIPADGSVTVIGKSAFWDVGLQEIELPSGITKISDTAFYKNSLRSLSLPEGLTTIGSAAFSNNYILSELSLPSTLEMIWYEAFQYCNNLKKVHIPKNVTWIDSTAFQECTSITQITVDENNRFYHSAGNCLIDTENKVLVFGCKESIIPDDGSVEIIDSYAFYGCEIQSITIPDSVWQIRNNAFSLSTLTSIVLSNNLTQIDEYAFNNCNELTRIVLPEGLEMLGKGVFLSCENLEEVVLPSSLVGLDIGVFAECPSLKSIVFTSNLTCVNNEMFQNCTSLQSVTIPKSVTAINFQAFYGCSNLQEINFGGTMAEWVAVEKDGETWDWATGDYVVKCIDGTLAKDGSVIN
ncbi:MAG: leucine-rich repeat domain-containing protein [Clostridia bacterium]|nr:leucine-rich repeat domain-containing protein [Clostridia bacterium]